MSLIKNTFLRHREMWAKYVPTIRKNPFYLAVLVIYFHIRIIVGIYFTVHIKLVLKFQ